MSCIDSGGNMSTWLQNTNQDLIHILLQCSFTAAATTVTLTVPTAAVCVLCTWRKIKTFATQQVLFLFAKKVLIYHDSIHESLFWFHASLLLDI